MSNWYDSNVEIGLSTLQSIRTKIEDKLNRCGLMCRVFARSKSLSSLKRKLDDKGDSYSPTGKKVQDILGFRVIFYFISDVRIFCEELKKETTYSDISDSENEFKEKKSICANCGTNPNIRFEELFRPERLNLIFKMDDQTKAKFRHEIGDLPKSVSELIDDTYEVQLRSVLSEG